MVPNRVPGGLRYVTNGDGDVKYLPAHGDVGTFIIFHRLYNGLKCVFCVRALNMAIRPWSFGWMMVVVHRLRKLTSMLRCALTIITPVFEGCSGNPHLMIRAPKGRHVILIFFLWVLLDFGSNAVAGASQHNRLRHYHIKVQYTPVTLTYP